MNAETRKTRKGKPIKGRPRFSSGFEPLDEVYRKVSEQINSSAWMRPFYYEFNRSIGPEGTHSLTIGEQFRFTREQGQSRVETHVKTSSGWRLLAPTESPDRFDTPRPGKDPPSSLLHSVSPVFWPISSASSRQSMNQVLSLVSVLWNQQIASLRNEAPELFTRRKKKRSVPYPHEVEAISHADRALMVLSRRVRFSSIKGAKSNYRYAIKCWWDHFVDPALFKSLVGVIGSTASTVVDFSNYAAFTRTPDLPNILERVKVMGLERRLLGGVPFTSWGPRGVMDLLSHWPHGQAQRFLSLPQSMLAGSYQFVEEKALPGNVVSRVIDVLEKVAHTPKVRLRQQSMAAAAMFSLARRQIESESNEDFFSGPSHIDVFHATLNRADLPGLLVDMVHVWRNAFPQEYANYSASSRSEFISDALTGLTVSPPSRLDFAAYEKAPDNVRSCLHSSPMRYKILAAASSKYAIEKLIPRRGRGRPRKNDVVKLPVNAPSAAPRPLM